ncbi:hypothetical protein B0T13DRAFT_472693 [Neurospora crassa]|nr:hypothetical protein B0T13DRAFT_472693 [Neurospora crassa]
MPLTTFGFFYPQFCSLALLNASLTLTFSESAFFSFPLPFFFGQVIIQISTTGWELLRILSEMLVLLACNRFASIEARTCFQQSFTVTVAVGKQQCDYGLGERGTCMYVSQHSRNFWWTRGNRGTSGRENE